MLNYIVYRLFQLFPLLVLVSLLTFLIIELPPGDYLTSYVTRMEESGTKVDEAVVARLKQEYGLDKPLYSRYLWWMWKILSRGDFGRSFSYGMPVTQVIGDRLMLTMIISLCSLLFVWATAIPIGIYAATHQYSAGDYFFTFLGFIGMAVPGFLLALVLMYVSITRFNFSSAGLFSPEYADAPWSFAKVFDMLKRLWLPVIIIGIGGTAGLIRVMRGTLLDELRKPYVTTARSKGLSERKLLFKYPVRIAINPMISTIGWLLPTLVSGEGITSIVLNLPTCGPVLVMALMNQDMYLAGSFVLILSTLTVIGTVISDILLAAVDPRIRYGAAGQ
ncbi:MAG: ABC transporter permease [Anaerolineae bacterium]|nr:ABC transporter permease [Anaerolineae bacterium]